MENIKLEMCTLNIGKDGSYTADKILNCGKDTIEIPEEYDGIPVTRIFMNALLEEYVCTVRVPKNVKEFFISSNFYQDSQPFFVEISPENPYLCADEKAVFSKDKTVLYAFTARSDESYSIPEGVKKIAYSAFFAVKSLKELTFPESLEELDESAFEYCSVRDWVFPKGLKKLGPRCMRCVSADSFVLPENIEQAAPDAFDRARSGAPVRLPDCFCKPNLPLPNFSFTGEYIIDENSKTLTVVDGVIYTKDMKTLLATTKKSPEIITVPDGVEIIGANAGENNYIIKEMRLPKSVHTISECAFAESGIEKIDLENVRVIERRAFSNCVKLNDTGKIGAELIGSEAFYACKSLENVCLTNAKKIETVAFGGLEKCTEISLPEGLEMINSSALNSPFTYVRIPRSVKTITSYSLPRRAEIVELYDVENSPIYSKDEKMTDFKTDCLIRVLSPETDEIKYIIKIFPAEKTEEVDDSKKYINSLFGNDKFFDLEKYDEYFKTVSGEYGLISKYKAAHYRVTYPVDLTEENRKMYIDYLEKFSAEMLRLSINAPAVKASSITNFPYLYAVDAKELKLLIKASAEQGRTEVTAFLMNYKNEHFPDPEIPEDEL